MKRLPDKGGRAEEALREYFLKAGYYAVRGVPYVYDHSEVTDVDIWLYIRPSPLGRERISVDSKDRGKPKALERILWAKGLQATLGLERCIVATTDKRPLVRRFGQEHDVLVLDGDMLSRLVASRLAESSDRISEEEFVSQIDANIDRLLGRWHRRMLEAKSRLLSSLDFNGCNAWLEDFEYFAHETLISGRRDVSCRLVYLILSFLLIGLDYSTRSLAFDPAEVRRAAVQDGFRYGNGGWSKVEHALKLTTSLIDTYAPEAAALGAKMRGQLANDAALLRVDILAEYFTRTDVTRELFNLARLFESHAFARQVIAPSTLEPSLQAVLGVILDFLSIDRVTFFKALDGPVRKSRVSSRPDALVSEKSLVPPTRADDTNQEERQPTGSAREDESDG